MHLTKLIFENHTRYEEYKNQMVSKYRKFKVRPIPFIQAFLLSFNKICAHYAGYQIRHETRNQVLDLCSKYVTKHFGSK
jgi:hypothetical protein